MLANGTLRNKTIKLKSLNASHHSANNKSSEVCGHLLLVTYLIKPFDQAYYCHKLLTIRIFPPLGQTEKVQNQKINDDKL